MARSELLYSEDQEGTAVVGAGLHTVRPVFDKTTSCVVLERLNHLLRSSRDRKVLYYASSGRISSCHSYGGKNHAPRPHRQEC